MDSRALVTRIAILLVVISLLGVIFELIFLGSRGIVGNIAGLILTGVLAFFIIAGHNWARWIMAFRCGLSAILCFLGWTQLGNLDISIFSIIRLWLLFVAVFSGVIAAYLLLSKRVSEHFTPSSGL